MFGRKRNLHNEILRTSYLLLGKTAHKSLTEQIILTQECILVWCVPTAAVAISSATHARAPRHALPTPRHTCPLPCKIPRHTRPPPDRILDTRLWKHYLSASTIADGNKRFHFIAIFMQEMCISEWNCTPNDGWLQGHVPRGVFEFQSLWYSSQVDM